MTARIHVAEGPDEADSPQETGGVASPIAIALEESPSKRQFLKSVLLAGVAANLILALPQGVSASSFGKPSTSNNSSTTTAKPSALNLSRVFRFNDPKTGAPQISAFP